VIAILVEKGPDVADDCIAAEVRSGDVVITADIPLAARCIEAGGRVLGNSGRRFTEESIGGALATRDLMSDLREAGVVGGGPRPMSQRDRSRFAQSLEEIVRESLQELET
jgi:uncharacterized protein YaiI (UPF0178 family)